ncbi:ABC transporter permease [Sphaerotilus mobilis]|uniref:Nucleoside ABC transporter membrane protein n=1 Tax=Sphaerotilus mobilis TaxID=47994 RepID=A0A4Q7LB78_9BURK|nr:ABC transporter permease [Sphaerotilus mobilis]RZS47407.1 nucleoside ABC transporter membrane protein [Sphaerotilus mobilis]
MSAPRPLPRWIDIGVLPLLNVTLAMLAAGVLVALLGHSPWSALQLLADGAFGSRLAWGYTLYYSTNFIFTGLAVAVAAQAGHFNIGGEGQATLGGIGVALLLLGLDAYLPAVVLLPLVVLAAALSGAAWAAVPAWLQARRGSHIVITTIMFNFLASTLIVWLLVNVIKEPGTPSVETRAFAVAGHLPSAQQVAAWVGVTLPVTPLNLSLLLALACAVGVWLMLWHTRLGYALRALGDAPHAAHYAGFSPKRLTVVALMLSGALAGGVGVNEVSGVHHRLLLDFVAGAGFTGIAVALMGRNHPGGIVLAALLFGALAQGGSELAFEIPAFTRDMVIAVQGLVVLFCGALALMLRPLVVALWQRWPQAVPATAGQGAGAGHG